MGMRAPMLSGRPARAIVTADMPGRFRALIFRNAFRHQTGGWILRFAGLRPVRFTYVSGVSTPAARAVDGWTARVARPGDAAA